MSKPFSFEELRRILLVFKNPVHIYMLSSNLVVETLSQEVKNLSLIFSVEKGNRPNCIPYI